MKYSEVVTNNSNKLAFRLFSTRLNLPLFPSSSTKIFPRFYKAPTPLQALRLLQLSHSVAYLDKSHPPQSRILATNGSYRAHKISFTVLLPLSIIRRLWQIAVLPDADASDCQFPAFLRPTFRFRFPGLFPITKYLIKKLSRRRLLTFFIYKSPLSGLQVILIKLNF